MSTTLKVGQSFQLHVTYAGDVVSIPPGSAVRWVSNGPATASVQMQGVGFDALVTALAPGTATITCEMILAGVDPAAGTIILKESVTVTQLDYFKLVADPPV